MAKRINLYIDQGTDFSAIFDMVDEFDVPINTSSYTFRSSARKVFSSAIAFSLNVNRIPNTLNKVEVSIDAGLSVTIEPGKYVYDILAISPNALTTKAFEGLVEIIPTTSIERPIDYPPDSPGAVWTDAYISEIDGGTSDNGDFKRNIDYV